jgi:hypothetical protein
VSTSVQRDRRCLVSEHPLDRFDGASDGDGETGGGVTEIVDTKPDQIRVRFCEGPDSGQSDGPAEVRRAERSTSGRCEYGVLVEVRGCMDGQKV